MLLNISLAFNEPLADLVLHGLLDVWPLQVSDFVCDGGDGLLVVLLIVTLLQPPPGFVAKNRGGVAKWLAIM